MLAELLAEIPTALLAEIFLLLAENSRNFKFFLLFLGKYKNKFHQKILTDFKGPTIFFCYGRNTVSASIENKREQVKKIMNLHSQKTELRYKRLR